MGWNEPPTKFIAFPRKLLNLLGVFLGVLVFHGTDFWGLFGVPSSEDCSQWLYPTYPGWRALDSQRGGTELPGLLAMPIETLGHTLKWKKAEGCWNVHPCKAPFFCTVVQFGCCYFTRTGLLRSEPAPLLLLRCNHADVTVQYRVFKREKRAEGTLQPYSFDGDLKRIYHYPALPLNSPSFGSSTASVLGVKHGKDKGFEKKTTQLSSGWNQNRFNYSRCSSLCREVETVLQQHIFWMGGSSTWTFLCSTSENHRAMVDWWSCIGILQSK